VPLEPVPDCQIQQPGLFGFVDDVEIDPGAAPDAIEEHIAVAGFAHGAGRGGRDPADAVQLHRSTEPVHCGDHGIAGPRPDGSAGGERVATEWHTARKLLDDTGRVTDEYFGDCQANGAGAHV
jgi:hypothetical protein